MTELRGSSINSVYIQLLSKLRYCSTEEYGTQKGENIHALHDVELVIENPRATVLSLPLRDMSRKYAAGELSLYMHGTDNARDYAFYSSVWKALQTPEGRISSAYGYRLFTPRKLEDACVTQTPISRWDYAVAQLCANPSTKNAVIHVRDDTDMADYLVDRCCTMFLHFWIAGNRLNMRTVMRSSDVWLGVPYDVFCFTRLMQYMLYCVNTAAGKHYTLGTYTHQMLNVHAYPKHWERIQNADLTFPLDEDLAYEFPEYDAHTEEQRTKFLEWEKAVYRKGTLLSMEEKARLLREAKFCPFWETLGSWLVNKANNVMPTQMDITYMRNAITESLKSKCVDRQVGCVLVTPNGDTFAGHNTVMDCNAQCDDKVNRVCHVTHAEIDALTKAGGTDLTGAVAYVTLCPCLPCYNALTHRGVTDIRVMGFVHKGMANAHPISLYDPEYCRALVK